MATEEVVTVNFMSVRLSYGAQWFGQTPLDMGLDVTVRMFNGCNDYNELTLNKGDYLS